MTILFIVAAMLVSMFDEKAVNDLPVAIGIGIILDCSLGILVSVICILRIFL